MVSAILWRNLPVLKCSYNLPKAWTDRFAHVNDKQPRFERRRRDLEYNDNIETVMVEICQKSNDNVLFGVCYRPPSSDVEYSLKLRQCLEKIEMTRFATCYLVGDFNFPSIDWHSLTATSSDLCTVDFCDMLNDHFLVQCNFNPTRMLNETDGNILSWLKLLTWLVMLKFWLIILILIIFRLVSILSFYLVALVSLSQGKITTLKRQVSLHWMNYWSIFHGIVLSWKTMWTSVLKESMTYY